MIFDTLGLFSNDQAITASAASNSVVDLGAQGAGVPTPNIRSSALLCGIVTAAFNKLTTLKVALQSSTDEEFSSPVEHRAETVALADLVVGKKLDFGRLPVGLNRYIRLYYTVDGEAPSTGTIFAGLTLDDQTL